METKIALLNYFSNTFTSPQVFDSTFKTTFQWWFVKSTFSNIHFFLFSPFLFFRSLNRDQFVPLADSITRTNGRMTFSLAALLLGH